MRKQKTYKGYVKGYKNILARNKNIVVVNTTTTHYSMGLTNTKIVSIPTTVLINNSFPTLRSTK